ncbi:MAG: NifU family protein [Candidatus Omnitrophota bacterium]|nr:NifU family protein [Candidatus Omnitrophota bacterium]MDP3785983.1 NifU family protein [Candidatus Omnitrophota bacterium]
MAENQELKTKIQGALSKIRPMLQADGGDIELIDVVGKVVKVKLTGACGCCPMSQMTLQMGVQRAIKEVVPEIERVEAV